MIIFSTEVQNEKKNFNNGSSHSPFAKFSFLVRDYHSFDKYFLTTYYVTGT